MSLELARTVADAVLYEGYLLYPYRATSSKNRVRWQFGVLGPPGASAAGLGEESTMATQCLLEDREPATLSIRLRFLQLQARGLERPDASSSSGHVAVDELKVSGQRLISWDEAVEQEVELPQLSVTDLQPGTSFPVRIEGSEEVEELSNSDGSVVGRIVRRRWPLQARLHVTSTTVEGFTRLSISVENTAATVDDKDDAIRGSLIGAHLLLCVDGTQFVSLLEPPPAAAAAAASCKQYRCWPVLAGLPGDTDVVLASPIILYDYPEVAAQSAGALFDSTEIDEILTLRVMTLTEEEKAEARATDPRAREIIDRCDQMSPEALQQLHGILRDPRAELVPGLAELHNVDPPSFDTGDVPWWDPAADASVQPEVDAVVIAGVSVSKGSLVRVHPSRRADAQDLFFADQVARVTAVLGDVDGDVHVAVVLVDDPASDLHDWYGRYLYFAPDELEPLPTHAPADHPGPDHREESRS